MIKDGPNGAIVTDLTFKVENLNFEKMTDMKQRSNEMCVYVTTNV